MGTELRVILAGLRTLGLRPTQRPSDARGPSFAGIETSTYPSLVVALIVLLVIEAPALHFLLGALMDEGLARSLTRAGLLLSSGYLGVWLLGDLRLLRETPGVTVAREALMIELGARVTGEVGLDNIIDIGPIGANPSDAAIRITPQPEPNCRVLVREPVTLRGLFGRPQTGTELALYVDDPAGLVAAVREAQAKLANPTLP